MKKYHKALENISKAIELDPKNYKNYFIRATIEDKLNMIDEELKDAKKAADLSNLDPDMYNYYGYSLLLYKGKKDVEEAISYIKKALMKDPKNPSYLDSLAYGYYLKGELDKALKIEKEAFDKNKKDPVILEHLGDIYKDLGDKDLALKFYKKAFYYVKKFGEEEKGQKLRLIKKINSLKHELR